MAKSESKSQKRIKLKQEIFRQLTDIRILAYKITEQTEETNSLVIIAEAIDALIQAYAIELKDSH